MFKVDISHYGLGVFCTKPIQKNRIILQFKGPIITFDEALHSGNQGTNPLQIEIDQYIDIGEPGVFINHSCDPNCGIINDVFLIARRDIFIGEELYFDYSTTVEEDYWSMQCNCNSLECRKTISDFKYIKKSIRKKYLDENIVQRFISVRYTKDGDRIDIDHFNESINIDRINFEEHTNKKYSQRSFVRGI